MSEKLQGEARHQALATLPDWAEVQDRDAIFRHYLFKDFQQAFAFMTMVAMAAEKADHHPEWYNVYNRVEVMLSTHDADGLTVRDIELARYMERAAARIMGSL